MIQKKPNTTIVGTDIDEVKRKNAESGLSYKEAMELLARSRSSNTSLTNRLDAKE